MNEQLEQPIEGGTGEVLPEAAVSPAGEETAEEKAGEAGTQEAGTEEIEVNIESPTDETAENADSDAGLSASEDPVAQPLKKEVPPLSGQRSVATGVNDLPVAGQSRGVTEPQRDGDHASGGGVSESPRNYYAEWQELAEAHPEVVGKELPEDIYQECMRSELPPLRVYESMMLRKQAEQISALQQEIATLRQNAENTARAPVSAAAGSPENEPEDQFMQGFNSY